MNIQSIVNHGGYFTVPSLQLVLIFSIAVADAFFVAVIGVPVVDVPSLDAVLSTTAFADVVAASNQSVCLIRLSNYQFNGESNLRWRWVALLRFMIGPKHSGLPSQPITSIEN